MLSHVVHVCGSFVHDTVSGFWLGDGSMADGKVTYENTKASDVAWLKEALPRAGLSASAGGAVATLSMKSQARKRTCLVDPARRSPSTSRHTRTIRRGTRSSSQRVRRASTASAKAAIEDAEVDLSGWMAADSIPCCEAGALGAGAPSCRHRSRRARASSWRSVTCWCNRTGRPCSASSSNARVLSVGAGASRSSRSNADSPLFVVCAPHPGGSDRHTIAAHLRLAELLAKGALTPAAMEVVDSSGRQVASWWAARSRT